MKKSSLFILKSFLGPFTLTFFIAIFVLLMQFVWKYIEDMVGKGLELHVIGELLFYTSASMVPLALPLAILLSSLMTFGNLGEHYELVAFKSAGISLQRIMKPMAYLILVMSIIAFMFSNYILPVANLKMRALLYDIMQQKPAVNLLPGIFYNDIEGYTIKVKDKVKENKVEVLKDVMIYDHTEKMGNRKVIVAQSGTMVNTPDKRFLEITLNNGHAYEDQIERKKEGPLYRHFKNDFKQKTIRIDLSQFQLNRTDEDLFKSHYEMLNLKQLDEAVDTLENLNRKRQEFYKSGLNSFIEVMNITPALLEQVSDSAYNPWDVIRDATSEERNSAFNTASNMSRGIKTRTNAAYLEYESRMTMIIKHIAQWHKKITLSYACIVLFLIGAPLGSIIRKGGLGMPVVVSVIFFLLFHVLNITGEKLTKEGLIDPAMGMWMASLVLTPLGIFITYKATTDSTLFDLTSYTGIFRKLFPKKAK